MTTPYEIVAGPLTLYLAPVATAFPAVDAASSGSWIKAGSSGDRNYDESGVTVSHSQSVNEVTPAGAVGPVKAFRTGEALKIMVTLWDTTLEQYAAALNGNTVSTTAAATGTAGFKKIGLSKGQSVKLYALLARGGGLSPYGEGWSTQYEVPICYQSADPKPVYVKGKPAGIELEFTALEDPGAGSADQRFGRLVSQHAAAL